MDKLKQWVTLTVVGVLVIGAAGYFLLISPKRTEAADVRVLVDQQVSANSMLKTQIQTLKAQAKLLPQQQAKLAAVAAKIPDNSAMPTLIRALSDAADEAGVELVSLAPSPPTVVAAAPGAAPVAPVAGGAPAATGAGAPAARTVAPVSSSAGVLQSIGLSLNVVGGYFQVEQFLDRLENLSRALKVTTVSLAPGSNPVKPATDAGADPGRVLTATITGSVYLATGRSTTAAPAVVGK